MTWLSLDFYGIPLRNWAIAAGVLAGITLFAWALRRLLRAKLSKARETENEIDDLLLDLVMRTRIWLVLLVAMAAAVDPLELPVRLVKLIRSISMIAGTVQAGLWGIGFIDFWLGRYRRRRLETDPAAVTTISAFGVLGKIALWIVLLVVVLGNLGFEVTGLVTGLGIGGVAVALATQNILGDLFSSLSIVIDKPFVIGDYIAVGTDMGTVEKIGLKTTRVRSLSGEQLIFSNSDLLQSRVRNFKRMMERRVVFRFGVLYSTPPALLERIPQVVREAVESQADTRFDRSHFVAFGDSSLDFETVYWMLVPDYNRYMDVHQQVNLQILRKVTELGAGFAFPTRTLHVETLPASAPREPSA